MEFRFDAIGTLNWLTKIVMRAISNVNAGRIWPVGRRFPIPVVRYSTLFYELPHFIASI